MKTLSLVFALALLSSPVRPCFNNPNFSYFYAGMYRGCQNIRIENLRREEMCSRFPQVAQQCPQTCGICCLDEPDFRFKTRNREPKNKTCEWLTEQSAEDKNKFCRRWSSGRMIRDACPLACDFCQPAVLQRPPTPKPVIVSPPPTPSPTKPPTPSPTAAPTKSPTMRPTKPPTKSPTARPTNPPRSGEPTPSPTKAPTKSPTKAPTKPPTVSPTFSSSQPTFVCKDKPNFKYSQNQYVTCNFIQGTEDLRKEYCGITEVVNNCPWTCGICCSDDKDYKFTTYLGTKKKCGWVKLEKIRQNRYCEKVRDGRLVKMACPVTCDFCFEPVVPNRWDQN